MLHRPAYTQSDPDCVCVPMVQLMIIHPWMQGCMHGSDCDSVCLPGRGHGHRLWYTWHRRAMRGWAVTVACSSLYLMASCLRRAAHMGGDRHSVCVPGRGHGRRLRRVPVPPAQRDAPGDSCHHGAVHASGVTGGPGSEWRCTQDAHQRLRMTTLGAWEQALVWRLQEGAAAQRSCSA